MEPITIHRAAVADAPTIVRIYVDSWNIGFNGLLPARQVTANLVTRWESDLASVTQRWWVAKVNGAIVGFAGIGPSRDPVEPSLGELDTIAVSPTWWRRGIGQRLMLEALHWLKTDGYREAVLWTLAHYLRGQRFYEAMGWQLDGGIRDEGRQIRYRYRLRVRDEVIFP